MLFFHNNTFSEAIIIISNKNLIISLFYITNRLIYEEMKKILANIIYNYTYKNKIVKYFNKNEFDIFFNVFNNKDEF